MYAGMFPRLYHQYNEQQYNVLCTIRQNDRLLGASCSAPSSWTKGKNRRQPEDCAYPSRHSELDNQRICTWSKIQRLAIVHSQTVEPPTLDIARAAIGPRVSTISANEVVFKQAAPIYMYNNALSMSGFHQRIILYWRATASEAKTH